MAAESDNLDARMEVIRLKNEELEKKHKEIIEDELNAKRQNATVDIKCRDIEKTNEPHPYDKLDLDFDVKDTDKEMAKNPDYIPKHRRPMAPKELLDEIPPDPVNFLREDGDDDPRQEPPSQSAKMQNRNRNQRNRPERPRPARNNNEAEAVVTGDSPPRPRNPRQQQQKNRSPQDSTAPRKPPQQLRNERRSAPVPSEDSPTGQSPQHGQQNRQRRPNNNRPPTNKEGGDRNNITVQITDGEVRSVKLKATEKTFGTGRVGHSRTDNIQKFTVDTFDPESAAEKPHHQSDRSPQDKQRTRNPRNAKRIPKPQKEFQHPTLENLIITKTSVQNRLLKVVKDEAAAPEVNVAQAAADNGN